ncbi:MAG: tRNA (adenosine(37)-N6)-threonylcarbamoyltransferase complex ATPase subunit type 1 TsaE [Bacteroidota bacterium]
MVFSSHNVVSSENETAEVAREFSKALSLGDIVLLNGDLGSGKTFFVRCVCLEFGIKNVSSPSFAIVNEYHNHKKIIHFDFYRIKKVEELYDIGFEDYINSNEAIVFIEWANMFPVILPKRNYQIEFKFVNNSSRKISILKNE